MLSILYYYFDFGFKTAGYRTSKVFYTRVHIYYCIGHKQMSYMIYEAIMRKPLHHWITKLITHKNLTTTTRIYMFLYEEEKKIVDRLFVGLVWYWASLSLNEVSLTFEKGSEWMLRCMPAPMFVHLCVNWED